METGGVFERREWAMVLCQILPVVVAELSCSDSSFVGIVDCYSFEVAIRERKLEWPERQEN